jgi:glucuronate isomerase
MDTHALGLELERALREIPLMDAHTHLDASHLAARGLHDVLLYHMVVSDLATAGCPDRERLPERPTDEEARARIERALPSLPAIANTSCSWGLRIILEDLYGWRQPVTTANWSKLDGLIRERAKDPAWPREAARRAGIARSCTELWRRGEGAFDDMLQYSLEWGFFARSQWGECDTAVWELEKAWSEGAPAAPSPVSRTAPRPEPARKIRTVADVEAALDAYVQAIPSQVLSTAQHISTDIAFREVDERTMAAALRRRARAGTAERDIYASYITEGFLARLERGRPGLVFQFSLGAEPLPHETAARLDQQAVARLAGMVARHPGISFQCFLAAGHANQALCTLARELPNLSLAGYWWHTFFPSFIERMMSERLDMLSTAKQVGFFSDAYTMEWSCAKAAIVRSCLSRVLAARVASGQYTRTEALRIAREILFETPRQLLGMEPAVTTVTRSHGGARINTRRGGEPEAAPAPGRQKAKARTARGR